MPESVRHADAVDFRVTAVKLHSNDSAIESTAASGKDTFWVAIGLVDGDGVAFVDVLQGRRLAHLPQRHMQLVERALRW